MNHHALFFPNNAPTISEDSLLEVEQNARQESIVRLGRNGTETSWLFAQALESSL